MLLPLSVRLPPPSRSSIYCTEIETERLRLKHRFSLAAWPRGRSTMAPPPAQAARGLRRWVHRVTGLPRRAITVAALTYVWVACAHP